ncbi:MAG TPA: hypothetical protein EYP57_01815, partial [Thermodesulfobacteriaceae bacterium]|nr:hypothetical protein [Thermodesulfobacteriaceae bacterium]
VGFLDRLAPDVPVIHIHMHENYGDFDAHLPIFTGPAGENDVGIRALLEKIMKRGFSGAIILEQWPEPRELLIRSRNRLLSMMGQHSTESSVPDGITDRDGDGFAEDLLGMDRCCRSWREKLGGVLELLERRGSSVTEDELAYLAIYLRMLGTGEVPCSEDGRHFRPNHISKISHKIHRRLAGLETPGNELVLRKIFPWLPSFESSFTRSEPLTRIRDIAHRNDIPRELKTKIKTTLQNKLHRCAGPEDLVTSQAILNRISAPGADYSPPFVEQFRIFHEELKEFFNASPLEKRLGSVAEKENSLVKDLAERFLAEKEAEKDDPESLASRLETLTELRSVLVSRSRGDFGPLGQELRLAEIGLEDYAFVILGRMASGLEGHEWGMEWGPVFRCLGLIVRNLELTGIDPKECRAVNRELGLASDEFDPADRERLLRMKAAVSRSLRLAEYYSKIVIDLFSGRVQHLGRALNVPAHAVRMYVEGDIRGSLVFQLSRLISIVMREIRALAGLPPWDVLVSGTARGRLVVLEHLADQADPDEDRLVILEKVCGDEEVPLGVTGIILGASLPHLSHLAIRARQAGVVMAAAEDRHVLELLRQRAGEVLGLDVTVAGVRILDCENKPAGEKEAENTVQIRITPPEMKLRQYLLPLSRVTRENAGGKAFGARKLKELSHQPGAGFKTPFGMVVSFGAMERALDLEPDLREKYSRLVAGLNQKGEDEFLGAVRELRAMVESLAVHGEIIQSVGKNFAGCDRLMVRSSTNCEDLEEMAGAGLYDSFACIHPENIADGIRRVWGSLWTRRAAMSRRQVGIPHEKAAMAVLIQQMITPEYSFAVHTENPVIGRDDEVYMELAVGLGEVLASGAVTGSPYRLIWNKKTDLVTVLAFADLSLSFLPDENGEIRREKIDYTEIRLTTSRKFRNQTAGRVGAASLFIEKALGLPQDIEGCLSGADLIVLQARPQQGIRHEEPRVNPAEQPVGHNDVPENPDRNPRFSGLFQKRIEGDDALLELARIRFRESGLKPEIYAGSEDELQWILGFSPFPDAPAIIHLSRDMDIFRAESRKRILSFATSFHSEVYGMVIHDAGLNEENFSRYGAYLKETESLLHSIEHSPYLFVEYASGADPDLFCEFFAATADLNLVSVCIDTGHIGIREARRFYRERHPGDDVCRLRASDPDLPSVIRDVEESVRSALPAVLNVTRKICALGKPVHFHLHDGHPLWDRSPYGVSDHMSFLEKIRLPAGLPEIDELRPMFGPEGLEAILREALGGAAPERASFTVEIHPSGGRESLGEYARLFAHWADLTHAEHMNCWLSAILQNYGLMRKILKKRGA